MTKAELRQELKAQRGQLTPDQITAKSQAIIQRLIEIVDLLQLKSVHCYSALATEIDTTQLHRYMEQKPIAVTVPLGRTVTPAELDAKYDLIIVPLLGFDSHRQRLGYGGGFYDRLLAAHPEAVKIGLAYDLSHVAELPAEPHDQKLDAIITETKIYPPGFAYKRSQRV